jgi:hypothetical protein
MTIVSVPNRPDPHDGSQSNAPSVGSISGDGEMGSLIRVADLVRNPHRAD